MVQNTSNKKVIRFPQLIHKMFDFFGLFEEQYMVSKFDGNERKFNYWAITERGDGLLLVSNCKFLWLSIKV